MYGGIVEPGADTTFTILVELTVFPTVSDTS